MFLVDLHRHPERDTDLLYHAAFITFFPHLIAGPIVRPDEMIPQMRSSGLARPVSANISEGLLIFLLGLGKKLVLGGHVWRVRGHWIRRRRHRRQPDVFRSRVRHTGLRAANLFRLLRLLRDGDRLARMMNIRFPINFASPYKANDIAAFWRRWHITLGLFLRDYLSTSHWAEAGAE